MEVSSLPRIEVPLSFGGAYIRLNTCSSGGRFIRPSVAKMASHAIFQYNVLAIDDTHNT